MPSTPISGRNGTLTLATVAYAFGKWTGTHKRDVIDVSNSGGGGGRNRVVGLESFDGSFEGPFDTALAIYKQTNIAAGTSVAAVFGMDGTHTASCNVVCGEVEITTDYEGAVTYKVSFSSDGPVTFAP